MRKTIIALSLFAILLTVSACTEIVIDEIKTLQVTNLNVEEFVVDKPIDLSKIKVTVVYTDDSDREDETLDLDEVNFYLRDPDNALIDVERDEKGYLEFTPQAEGTYSLYVSYGGVSVTITFDVPGDATDIQLVWDGNYPTGKPGTFVLDDDNDTVTLNDATALAWFAETLNDDTEDSTILREDGYEGFTVKLEANIDLGGKVWTPIGTVVPFKGSFDGGNHTISNLLLSDERVDVSTFYTLATTPPTSSGSASLAYKSIKSGLFYSLGHNDAANGVVVSNLTIELADSKIHLPKTDPDTHPTYTTYNVAALAQMAINTTVRDVTVVGSTISIDLDQDSRVSVGGIIASGANIFARMYFTGNLDFLDVVIENGTVSGFDLTFKNANHTNGGAFTLGGVIGSALEGTLTITGTSVSIFHAAFDLTSTSSGIGELYGRYAGLAVTGSPGSLVVGVDDDANDLDVSLTVTDLADDSELTIVFGEKVGPYTDSNNETHEYTFDETGSKTVFALYNTKKLTPPQ
jgi:hypothetical protein